MAPPPAAPVTVRLRSRILSSQGGAVMAELVKDVVCGMMIDPATAAATSEYKGAVYYFCAESCKQEFDANPSKFVNGASAAEQPAAAAAPAAPGKRWWEFWR